MCAQTLHGTAAQHFLKLAPEVNCTDARAAQMHDGHECDRTPGCTWSGAKHSAGTADMRPEQVQRQMRAAAL
eukprot:11171837-Alexandrium_andersonii.AAC.1